MSAPFFPNRTRNVLAACLPGLVGALALSVSAWAAAQSAEPGDIVVERRVMTSDAFEPVPKQDDPVAVKASTFPTQTFDASVATLVSDLDLTGARGSLGVATNDGVNAAGLQALTRLTNGVAPNVGAGLGTGSLAQSGNSLGGTVVNSVTGTLAPLGAALGALK
ncbi:hypothetical protein [Trinickia fusca]|uniref:Adhesin n=1 Tax=Trinickia fusca TaxID=2419777 RepID=A0A494XQV2_9BURK|nr:hypothetical protein [Trinickia fusca]RKP52011.1 hypothetical protein D7S89_00120 [Trinickia fusca]